MQEQHPEETMSEDNRATSDDVGERLARLEAAVAAMADEVRTRRLVVVDGHGDRRVVAEVVDATAEVRLELPAPPHRPRTSVLVFANPGDPVVGLDPGVGVQLWVDGEEVDRLVAWRDPS